MQTLLQLPVQLPVTSSHHRSGGPAGPGARQTVEQPTGAPEQTCSDHRLASGSAATCQVCLLLQAFETLGKERIKPIDTHPPEGAAPIPRSMPEPQSQSTEASTNH